MNVFEFVEFCRRCPRRKTCHFEGCILDEKPSIEDIEKILNVDAKKIWDKMSIEDKQHLIKYVHAFIIADLNNH